MYQWKQGESLEDVANVYLSTAKPCIYAVLCFSLNLWADRKASPFFYKHQHSTVTSFICHQYIPWLTKNFLKKKCALMKFSTSL